VDLRDALQGPHNTKISSEAPFWPGLVCCILSFGGPLGVN
jgi:hypothetical protein